MILRGLPTRLRTPTVLCAPSARMTLNISFLNVTFQHIAVPLRLPPTISSFHTRGEEVTFSSLPCYPQSLYYCLLSFCFREWSINMLTGGYAGRTCARVVDASKQLVIDIDSPPPPPFIWGSLRIMSRLLLLIKVCSQKKKQHAQTLLNHVSSRLSYCHNHDLTFSRTSLSIS
jgi:hypothetical protein